MALFDDLKDKAKDLAQIGITKSKQLAEIAKLKTSNLGEEENLKKAYMEVGKLYYAERGMAPEAAYAALCEKITACKVNMEENNARIEELRQNSSGDEMVVPSAMASDAPQQETSETLKEDSVTCTKAEPETATSEPVAEPVVPKSEDAKPISADPVVPVTPSETSPVVESLAQDKKA